MEHGQVQQETEGFSSTSLPYTEHAGWRVRTSTLDVERPCPWTLIDHEEYERCKDRKGYEFEAVYVGPSTETQRKFNELLGVAAVNISKFADGRYWVAVHPQKPGNLWWHECDKSLQHCIDSCHAKAMSFRLITRF